MVPVCGGVSDRDGWRKAGDLAKTVVTGEPKAEGQNLGAKNRLHDSSTLAAVIQPSRTEH